MSETTDALFSPKRLAIQVLGFVVGLVLLAWIIRNAMMGGDWSGIADAHPLLIAALLGSTVASTMLNGAGFWITIRPIQHIPFWDLQRLNVLANMLNYAPIRIGAIGRVLYHMRVDGLGFLTITAWFSLLGYIMVLGVSAAAFATVLRFDDARLVADPIWWALILGFVVIGGLVIRVLVGLPLVARYGQGLDRMVADRTGLWGAIGLRLADLACFTTRMAAAAAILKISITAPQVMLLALVALTASLIPFGRLGFREFCVAAVGQRLGMGSEDLEASMSQLALVESAGEAIVFVVIGIVLLPWMRSRWRSSRWGGDEAPVA